MKTLYGLYLLFVCVVARQPNILFIVADDLGWNDIGFRNPDMITPNMDKLANQGVIFESAYVLPVCSPSRAAFMSGIYPFKSGLQHVVIQPKQNVCLPLDIKTLPQHMKQFFFADRAQQIIRKHDKEKPLFMYLAFQNPHGPVEVPKKYSDMYPHVMNLGRKILSGMVSILDEAIGNITQTLIDEGMYNDTLILLTADNGAEPINYGNNYPLRGSKHSLWEGGTRVTSFMAGVGLQQTGIKYTGLIHGVDWMPTLLGAAGAPQVAGIDGINHWDSIRQNLASGRREFIYNLDDFYIPTQGHAAIRVGDWKLILGYPGTFDGWYKPMNETEDTPFYEMTWASGDKPARLFNIADDPYEYYDVADQNPDIVANLTDKINQYRKSMVPAMYPADDPQADTIAKQNGDSWTSGWC
ncbi:arylsulfatase B [Patella vulgata]|uniref:arylsulfatase B n=1 Tax=Patella vulgata TaxID=6465 RepID=UPI0024A90B2A|nr:arylsulfatase B [Patella vulgata]